MREIVKDESAHQYKDLLCENCHKVKPARHIDTIGVFSENRGSHIICFDCYGAQVYWKDHRNIVFCTPCKLY